MDKYCKECGDKFQGRSDAKFCSDQCRSSFNNKSEGQSKSLVKEVNRRLRKNRKVLAKLNPEGKARVRLEELVQNGLDINFLTNIYITKAGKTYHFCYDQGYIDTGDGWCTLVTKHAYV